MSSNSYDEALFVESLRRDDAYSAACEALEGWTSPTLEFEFEILVAGCGGVEGKPIVEAGTRRHLAICLAILEQTKSRPIDLCRRLNYFAQSFDCATFKEFRKRSLEIRKDLLANRSTTTPPPPAPECTISTPKANRVFYAALVGWGIAVPVAILLFAIGSVLDKARRPADKAETPTERTALRPVVPEYRPKAVTIDELSYTVTDDDLRQFLQPTPNTGLIRTMSGHAHVAPFEIRGSNRSHSLVKLRDAYSQAEIMTVFVRRGETASIEVPLGTFKVHWTSGQHWYGHELRFGNSDCWEAKETFNFYQTGNQIRGYTITLYEVRNGNLDKRSINPSDF